MADLFQDIVQEVERATLKFPWWPTDPIHAATVVAEEHGELMKAVLQACYEPGKATPTDVRAEAIQAAAMLIRFLAGMPYYAWQPGLQHGVSAPLARRCGYCRGTGHVERPGHHGGMMDCRACEGSGHVGGQVSRG